MSMVPRMQPRTFDDLVIEVARNVRAVKHFANVSDLARRAELDRHDLLQVLAAPERVAVACRQQSRSLLVSLPTVSRNFCRTNKNFQVSAIARGWLSYS